MLVTGKPPAPGTVLEDDFSAHVDVAGLSPTDTKIVDRTEVRPDGSARMVRLVNTRTTGDIVVHRAFEGVPLVWRSAAQGWSATLESGGTPTEYQAADLKSLATPFVTDSIYPARPVRLGERWNMSADAARDLLSRLEGLAVASEDVRDQVFSGWMELTSLADREGQQCALLRFALTVEFKATPAGMVRVNGDGVRSLVTFQDLNWEAKAEWIATGNPPTAGFFKLPPYRRPAGLPAGRGGRSTPKPRSAGRRSHVQAGRAVV
jgi:hypothetical protein